MAVMGEESEAEDTRILEAELEAGGLADIFRRLAGRGDGHKGPDIVGSWR